MRVSWAAVGHQPWPAAGWRGWQRPQHAAHTPRAAPLPLPPTPAAFASTITNARRMGGLTGFMHGTAAVKDSSAQGAMRMFEQIIGWGCRLRMLDLLPGPVCRGVVLLEPPSAAPPAPSRGHHTHNAMRTAQPPAHAAAPCGPRRSATLRCLTARRGSGWRRTWGAPPARWTTASRASCGRAR